MANDVYRTVCDCHWCAEKRGTTKRKRKMRLFTPNEPLQFVAINILGPLPKKETGNKHVVVVTDRFCRLTNATQMTKTTVTTVAAIFINEWLAKFGILWKFFTDNDPRFTSKFFSSFVKSWRKDRWQLRDTVLRRTDKSNVLTPR